MNIRSVVREVLKRTVYRPGSVARILAGPLRGLRYRVTDESGWAPIYGGWEPVAARLYCTVVVKGDCIFDAGANTGIHSLLFSRLAGESGHVVAFEPLPVNAALICDVLTLNGMSNVRVVEAALSDREGRASFSIGASAKQGSLVPLSGPTCEEISVALTTIDEFLNKESWLPDVLKVDVEGAEGALLRGYSNRVDDSLPTFFIDLHSPEQDLEVGAFLTKHGYLVFRLGDDVARRMSGQTEVLRRVDRLDTPWPDPRGIWGTVVAIHPNRRDVLERLGLHAAD